KEERRRTTEALRRTDEQRRRLLSKMVGIQEEERRTIAADIHDDSIQVMTALTLRLAALGAKQSSPRHQEDVQKLLKTAEDAIGRLRRLMFQVRPPALDREGLAAALRSYLQQALEGTGIITRVASDLDAEPEVDSRVIAYRIAQEAINNVRKHAMAGTLEVRLERLDGGLLGAVADDGVGFVPAERGSRPMHLGLVAMRERAELAGGWCRVH